jgi:hypothetical protein
MIGLQNHIEGGLYVVYLDVKTRLLSKVESSRSPMISLCIVP